MKKPHIYLFIIISSLLFSSCQSLYFTAPQPAGNPLFTEIPDELRGNYLAWESSAMDYELFYHVHSGGFVFYEAHDFSIAQDSLASKGMSIKDSLLYLNRSDIPAKDDGFPFTIKDGKLSGKYFLWEELLLGEETALTFDKGNYYLSMRDTTEENESWECVQLEILKNKNIIVWATDVKQESFLIKEYLGAKKVAPDSDDWVASPRKRQFRKYVKEGGFVEMIHHLYKMSSDELPDLIANRLENSK